MNEQEKAQYAIDNPLFGFMVLGNTSNYPSILAGEFDSTLKASLFFKEFGKAPESIEVLEKDQFSNDSLKKMKETIRMMVQKSVDEIAYTIPFYMQEQGRIKRQKKSFVNPMKEMNKPSEFGTVSEISTKFNISKAEVRRMKNDGSLETFIKNNS